MNCDVIRDLMILCVDGDCCEESRQLVVEHIRNCSECRKIFEEMRAELTAEEMQAELTAEGKPRELPDIPRLKRVDIWKASVLQSVTLVFSFVLLVFGVAQEAATPTGNGNGLWAISVIVPVTGFLLSLANWYFVRLYRDRKVFSISSILVTLGCIICGYVWAGIHYQNEWESLFASDGNNMAFLISGAVLSVLFCVLSYVLSRKYASMLGKE